MAWLNSHQLSLLRSAVRHQAKNTHPDRKVKLRDNGGGGVSCGKHLPQHLILTLPKKVWLALHNCSALTSNIVCA